MMTLKVLPYAVVVVVVTAATIQLITTGAGVLGAHQSVVAALHPSA